MTGPDPITDVDRRFLAARRRGQLATAGADGAPHVVPVCFALAGATLYVAIDAKPKTGRPLKRLANLAANPQAAFVADRWDEDWERLGWVMLRGRAEILADGPEHARAQALLGARYPQQRAMDLAGRPVIALRVDRVARWCATGAEEDDAAPAC